MLTPEEHEEAMREFVANADADDGTAFRAFIAYHRSSLRRCPTVPECECEVLDTRRFLPLAAGGLLAAAWAVLLDAMLVHRVEHVSTYLGLTHLMPGAVAMFGFFMMLAAPIRSLDERYETASGDCARLWMFLAIVLFCGSLIMSGFLIESMRATSESRYAYRQVNSTENETSVFDEEHEAMHVWVGYATFLQSSLIFASAGTCLLSRMSGMNND